MTLHPSTRLDDQAERPYGVELPIYVTLDRGSLFFDQTLPYLDLGTCKLRGVGSFALERLIELDLDAGFFVTDCSVGSSTAHTWTTLSSSGADDVCLMTSERMDDPGRPPGIVLSAATSFWIPIQPKQVFCSLWDENFMSETLFQMVDQCKKWHASQMAVIEETVGPFCVLIYPIGSYVIYALVDITAMNVVLSTVVVDKDLVTNRSEIVDVSLTRRVSAAIFGGGIGYS
ncbi:hypothetical protein Tco_0702861 [Tanacetum coccineum]|uniref:HD-Zip IV C-terminal domain-containing protein n=1 Tax=Tanacetum coccineum TaxID=301880 RepID=A0ABQ4XX79_9ASTR